METDASDRVIQLIEDYLDRHRKGTAPTLTEIADSQPELAAEVQRYLPLVALFENAAESQLSSGETTPEHSLALGMPFGRYHIKSILGRGGMGTVYLAHDQQLHRDVALKVPHLSRVNQRGVTRFFREARAMAQLHHRNLCPVHDVGDVDGEYFLSMSYIEGATLAETIQSKSHTTNREAAELVRKLASALQVAHEASIIHRDLKPSNVIIDREREPIILDFGLARGDHKVETVLTEEGDLIGSPSYMAPEQLSSDPTQVDHRVDVYGLGAILYEILCGRPPFTGSML
ncbi:MAG: serine/threonine protein kinase, partial [Planctomycetaceae bacterium]|nr:serine/threonine protein kinase [Planctomycetaceae bacterium]